VAALVFALLAIELVAYFVLLGQLASQTKARKPVVFAAVGGPAPWDYLTLGFGPGDTFISKLESRRSELADDAGILKLMKAVRSVYIAFLLTACAWFFVVVTGAN
jgi:hypothetical protein